MPLPGKYSTLSGSGPDEGSSLIAEQSSVVIVMMARGPCQQSRGSVSGVSRSDS